MNDTATYEMQDAARALERYTTLTMKRHPDEFLLVRRHATELKRWFGEVLGYRLVVESEFARVLKPPLPDTSPIRAMRGANGAQVTARVYQYVCLFAAALQAPGVGDQLLISSLVTQMRADAATEGIVTGESITERRDMVSAMNILTMFGAVEETEGTAAGWGADQSQEVLLTIDRTALSYLVANQLNAEPRTERPARTLARRLVEDPILNPADLTEDEQRVWSRDRTNVEKQLEEVFRLRLEVRREGALAWDDSDDATDEPFPGQGVPKQLALMFIAELVAARKSGNGGTVTVTDCEAERVIFGILEEYRGHLRADFEPSDPASTPHAKTAITSILTAVGLLAVNVDGTMTMHPAAARYGATITRRAAPTKTPDTNVSLFDDTGEIS
ncbi:TIGR02678 family protein [Diaminobutyricibacter sp. McL0618]|uniref:TIGR02678 family protein n=1 Tax=Leifsonia sp. McL0618 TaxID=3415677 RepID=UPI003CF22C69